MRERKEKWNPEVIEIIRNLSAEGFCVAEIRRSLNRSGFKSPNGCIWSDPTVARMVKTLKKEQVEMPAEI